MRVAVPPAVHKIIACREVLADPVVVVSVTSASEVMVVVPAIAESNSDVMLLFTVSPHVPDNSPVTGRAKPKSDVYAVVMFKPQVTTSSQAGFCTSDTFVQLGVCGLLIFCHDATCVSSIGFQ